MQVDAQRRAPVRPADSNVAQEADRLLHDQPMPEPTALRAIRWKEKMNTTTSKMKYVLLVATVGFSLGQAFCCNGVAAADRQPKAPTASSIYEYGPAGPNRSYRAGAHIRIYVTTRSWLDAGTEVLPEERKFTDYAVPPGTSFARENNSRPLDRAPLNPASDLGGHPAGFPLY
jgi:hypothetical protein